MSEAQEDHERLAISVQNQRGLPLVGAHVHVTYRGQPAGELVFNGSSFLEFDGREGLALKASASGRQVTVQIQRDQNEVVLVVPISRFIELAAVPTATCPDGTSGQPCVVCQVDGRRIRICA